MFGKPWNPSSPSTCLLSMLSTHQSITHSLQSSVLWTEEQCSYSFKRFTHHSPQKYLFTTSIREFSLVIQLNCWYLTSSTYSVIGWLHTQSWSVFLKLYFSYRKEKIPWCTFTFLIQELAELRHIYGINLLKAGCDERTIMPRLSEISTATQRFSFTS